MRVNTWLVSAPHRRQSSQRTTRRPISSCARGRKNKSPKPRPALWRELSGSAAGLGSAPQRLGTLAAGGRASAPTPKISTCALIVAYPDELGAIVLSNQHWLAQSSHSERARIDAASHGRSRPQLAGIAQPRAQ